MSKVGIIYWSATGNTEAMAEHIAAGLREAGAEVDTLTVSEADGAKALSYDILALGCPSMGDEVLEESEFEPFYTAVEDKLAGKKVALFGSYGWGDGQWMRDWHERAVAKGITLFDEGFIQNYEPDETECKAYGARLAAF